MDAGSCFNTNANRGKDPPTKLANKIVINIVKETNEIIQPHKFAPPNAKAGTIALKGDHDAIHGLIAEDGKINDYRQNNQVTISVFFDIH